MKQKGKQLNVKAELERLTKRYQGKSLQLKKTAKHDHAGEIAEVICYELTPEGDPAIKVKNEKGEFYVFSHKDYIMINTILPVRIDVKTGRNEPCPCGSGMKYKNCHLK